MCGNHDQIARGWKNHWCPRSGEIENQPGKEEGHDWKWRKQKTTCQNRLENQTSIGASEKES